MTAKSDVTLSGITVELYALPPDEFTSARNARAKELTDSALAAQVRALPKPLVAAWVVNLFAREHADELGQALDLARELREAQSDLDARALTTLTRQRRALIRALTQQAGDLATSRGERMTRATADAVEQTLNAAMFHADAAAAVASGRLARPLEAAGTYPADLFDAVAGEIDSAPAEAAEPVDEVKARRVRREDERALRSAEKDLKDAERERDDLQRQSKATGAESKRLAERLKELEAELAGISQEADRVEQKRDMLAVKTQRAEHLVEVARHAAEEAQSALADGTSSG